MDCAGTGTGGTIKAEPTKIVVRYTDGKVLKGYTNDFFPNKATFHFQLIDAKPNDKALEIRVSDLKAIFFVKDFAGNPGRKDRNAFEENQQTSGRKVELIFKDGEKLVGTTLGYDPLRPGFFITPADNSSNNLRAFVLNAFISQFRYL